jgi:hypothetical protein
MHIKNALVQNVNITVTVREDLAVSYDSTDVGISGDLLKMFAGAIASRGMRGLKRDYSNLSVTVRIGDVTSTITPVFDESIDDEL